MSAKTASRGPLWSWIVAVCVTAIALCVLIGFGLSWTLFERGPILEVNKVQEISTNLQITSVGQTQADTTEIWGRDEFKKQFLVDSFCAKGLQEFTDSIPDYVKSDISPDQKLPAETKIQFGVFVAENRKSATRVWNQLEPIVDKHCYGGNWGKIAVHGVGGRAELNGAEYFWRPIGRYDTDEVHGYLIVTLWGNTVSVLILESEKGPFDLSPEQVVKSLTASFN